MHRIDLRVLKRLLVAGAIGASVMLTTSGCFFTDTVTSTYTFAL